MSTYSPLYAYIHTHSCTSKFYSKSTDRYNFDLCSQDKSLMIYLLDDFHNIQTVRLPGANMKLSLATHMASNLLDIHQRVPAILLPSDKSKIHRIVTVNCKGQTKQCRGGIDTNYLSQLLKDCNGALKSTFLASLSDHFRSLKPRDIQSQLKEFRYWTKNIY